MKNTILNVEGMSCSHCENAVKKAVGALAGVVSIEVNLLENTVTAEYDETKISLKDIKATITEEGYTVIN